MHTSGLLDDPALPDMYDVPVFQSILLFTLDTGGQMTCISLTPLETDGLQMRGMMPIHGRTIGLRLPDES